MANNDALAYLTDYSTLQYYQTQLNCKLVVRHACGACRCQALGVQQCRGLEVAGGW